MKTINQLNGFCQTNQTIQFYYELRKNNYDYNKPQNFRNREYKFQERTDGKGKFVYSPMSNFIYSACEKELERFIGYSIRNYDERRFHKSIEIKSKHFDIKLQVYLEVEFSGVYISTPNLSFYKWLPKHNARWKVKSNQSIKDFDFAGYFVKRILPKYLYAPGFLRDIQLLNNCDKEKAKQIYKEWLVESQTLQPTRIIEENAEKALRRHLRKHFNLITDSTWNLNCLLDFRRKYGKQKRKTEIESYPSLGYLLTDFDGDIDEIESEYWNLYERAKPTIFV